MEITQVKCPTCGKRAAPDKYCGKCAAPLPKQKNNDRKQKKISIKDEDGTIIGRKSINYRNETELKQKIAEIENKKAAGPLFEDAAKIWKDYKFPLIKPTTRTGYRIRAEICEEYFSGKGLLEISPLDIENFYEDYSKRKGGLTRRSVEELSIIMKGIYKHKPIRDMIGGYNPTTSAELPTDCKASQPRIYPTKRDLEQIESNYDVNLYGLLLYTIRYTGVRLGEAFALTKGDIDFKNSEVNIDKSKYWVEGGGIGGTKTSDYISKYDRGARRVPLSDKLADIMQPHLSKLKKDDRIFASIDESRTSDLADNLRAFRESIGVTCDQHSLRHAYCSWLIFDVLKDESQTAIMTVARWLGHVKKNGEPNTEMTLSVYTHYSQEREAQMRKQAVVNARKNEQEKTEDAQIRLVK